MPVVVQRSLNRQNSRPATTSLTTTARARVLQIRSELHSAAAPTTPLRPPPSRNTPGTRAGGLWSRRTARGTAVEGGAEDTWAGKRLAEKGGNVQGACAKIGV